MLLFLIPVVNIVVLVVVSLDIARAFGKGRGFGCGLAFLGFLFYPVLGFGAAKYDPRALDGNSLEPGRTPYLPKITPDLRKQFEDLAVSFVNNYQGREINVGFARGSRILDDHLVNLIPLELSELYLSRTTISDRSIEHFEAMRQLRVLDLSHTRVSQNGINRLRQNIPEALIIG